MASAREGSRQAAAQLGPVNEMDVALAHGLIPTLLDDLARIRADAANGTAGLGLGDLAGDLTLVVLSHPDPSALAALLSANPSAAVRDRARDALA